MSDLEYTLRLICQRRGKTLTKIESVAFNVRLLFGLANATALFPATANVFYYSNVVKSQGDISSAGTPAMRITNNSGQGSAGTIEFQFGNGASFERIEFDSMLYIVSTHSAGSFFWIGDAFKVTYV